MRAAAGAAIKAARVIARRSKRVDMPQTLKFQVPKVAEKNEFRLNLGPMATF